MASGQYLGRYPACALTGFGALSSAAGACVMVLSRMKGKVAASLPYREESTVKPWITRSIGALSLVLVAATGHAETRMQADIGYRKAVMVALQWNLIHIAQMLRHQRPYNAAALQSEAQAISALSAMPWAAFVPGSDRGRTRAKFTIWQNPAAFSREVRNFESEAADLAAAAPHGLAAVGRPLMAVAHGCHACHHRFSR